MFERRLAAALVLILFAWLPALAQTSDLPVMGSSATDHRNGPDPDEPRQILVIGDALGGGLGAGLQRVAAAQGRYQVTIRFNEESGLARPEVYDWSATLPKILEGSDFDEIVVMIGSNDRQQIRSGNDRHAFNSEGWTAAYRAQADRLLDVLKASGARVYWVGLPPMADPDYDAAMQTVVAIQREQALAKGVTVIDMRPAFVDESGAYTDTGPDDTGEVRRLRGRDGVSFFKQGNNRMGQIVLAAIMAGGAGQTSEKPASSAAPTAHRKAVERDVPLFGRAGQFGEAMTLRPADVFATAVLVLGKGDRAPAAGHEAMAALRSLARTGSNAERLFSTGEAAAAPTGRIDDFSLPPAAP